MSVAFDAKMTGGDLDSGRCQGATNATSCSSTGMTIGGSASLLIGIIVFGESTAGTAPSNLAMTWNGVAMTLRANVSSVSGGFHADAYIFSLVSPDTGNHTLQATWSDAQDAYMSCVSFTGTDTNTGVEPADNTTATQTDTIGVPTEANGATVACFGVDGADPTVNQTEIFSTAPNAPGGGASYAIGGSTSNSHTFTGAGGSRQALAGVHVIAAPAGAPEGPGIIVGSQTSFVGEGAIGAPDVEAGPSTASTVSAAGAASSAGRKNPTPASAVTAAGSVASTRTKAALATSSVTAAGAVTTVAPQNAVRSSACSAGAAVASTARKGGSGVSTLTAGAAVSGAVRKGALRISAVSGAGAVQGTGTSAEAHTGASRVTASGRVTSAGVRFEPEVHSGASAVTAGGRVTTVGFQPSFSPAARVVARVVGGPLVSAQVLGRRMRKQVLV